MTVLHPWPATSVSAWPRLGPAGAVLQGAAAAFPPRLPSPHGAAGHRPLDLSALAKVRPAVARQMLSLRAGMAELVLLNRLRARTRRDASVDMLEQAARVIGVTARSWLAEVPAEPAQEG